LTLVFWFSYVLSYCFESNISIYVFIAGIKSVFIPFNCVVPKKFSADFSTEKSHLSMKLTKKKVPFILFGHILYP